MTEEVDVVVAGAGPAGSVAAHVLAQLGRRVAMIDNPESERPKPGESLPGAASRLLRDFGLLSLLEKGPHLKSYANLASWGSGELVPTDFIRDPNGLGWRLDRPRFDSDLRQAAAIAGASIIPERVRQLTWTGGRWRVQTRYKSIRCHWMIDATGRRAWIARNQGARRKRDDGLAAWCAWLPPGETDQDTRTLVESRPEGWWYSALLPNHARIVVFHTHIEKAIELRRNREAWKKLAQETVYVSKIIAGRHPKEAPRWVDAGGSRAIPFLGRGWLAVGDAAIAFDPISSQGIFNALYTGVRGAQAIHQSMNGNAEAIEEFGKRLESIRSAYLNHLQKAYASETRWPNSPFWKFRA